jgi:carbamoylphosphate synthase large subunit
MPRQAAAEAAVRPVVVVVKPIYGQAGTGFQVTHTKREKSPSTRT